MASRRVIRPRSRGGLRRRWLKKKKECSFLKKRTKKLLFVSRVLPQHLLRAPSKTCPGGHLAPVFCAPVLTAPKRPLRSGAQKRTPSDSPCQVLKGALKESKVFCFFFSKKKILLPNCC
jgi:hypothetical protein